MDHDTADPRTIAVASEPEGPASDPDVGERHRGRPRRHREWRTGGTSVQHWNWVLIGWGILALGAAVLVSTAATEFVGGVAGAWIGTAAVWHALLVPVGFAVRVSVPRGLLRFRPVDLLFGLVLGVALRFLAGGLSEAANGGVSVWPVPLTVDGALPGGWWFDGVLVPVLVAPVLEEFFFHGFLLVALFTVFRRLTAARRGAGAGALLVSTGLFLLLHQLTGSLAPGWDGAISMTLVGLVGGLLVLLTGRIWSALLLHVAFNGTYVALMLVGALVGVGPGAGLS